MSKQGSAKKRLILKTWVRVVLFITLSFLLALSIFVVYKGKNPSKDNIDSYNYRTNSNIDYKVYLFENNFYEEKYLGMNKQYTSALIDYVDIDFDYLFNGSGKANINYTYDITATIVGEYENTSNGKDEIWKKKYTLLEKQNKNVLDTTSFDIHQNVKIKYGTYNNIVNDFKTRFKLAIDAYLNVKLTVKYDSNIINTKSNVKDTDVLEINIPLNSSTIKITPNYTKATSKKLSKDDTIIEDPVTIRTGYTMLTITIIMFVLLIPKLFTSHKSYYLKQLNKIMKNYSEIIVEVTTPLNFDNLITLDIKTFDDMIDIEEEIKSPILYYEIEENKESWFIIVTEKYMYRYILKK